MNINTPLPPGSIATPRRTRGFLHWFATDRHCPPITDPAQINRLYPRYRANVITSITLAYAFLYTCRLGLSVVKKPLIDSGVFSATELGQIGSAIFYSYAIGKLVNGFLADHADVRKFFAVGMACSALVNLIMGASPVFWVWVLLWGINGWFQGFGAPACAVSLSNWFTKDERGRYYGIWSLAHSLGEGLTFIISGLLVVHFGWRSAFIGPGLFCLLVALGLFLFMKDRPQSLGLPDISHWHFGRPRPADTPSPVTPHPSSFHLLLSQLKILTSPPIWILGLSSATMYVSRYAINDWGILYLQEAKGYSLVQAGSILALNTLAGMAGAVTYGFISDNLFHARRPPVTLLYGIAETAALATVLYSPPGHPILLSIAFALFGFSLSGLLAVLGGLFAIDLVPKHATGAVMGIIGAFSYLGAALQDNITGLLLDRHSTLSHGTRHHNFSAVCLFWLSSSILSLLLASTLWRVKPKA